MPACVNCDACAADLFGALSHLTCCVQPVRPDSQSQHSVFLATAQLPSPLLASQCQACTCIELLVPYHKPFHHLCRCYACLLMVTIYHSM